MKSDELIARVKSWMAETGVVDFGFNQLFWIPKGDGAHTLRDWNEVVEAYIAATNDNDAVYLMDSPINTLYVPEYTIFAGDPELTEMNPLLKLMFAAAVCRGAQLGWDLYDLAKLFLAPQSDITSLTARFAGTSLVEEVCYGTLGDDLDEDRLDPLWDVISTVIACAQQLEVSYFPMFAKLVVSLESPEAWAKANFDTSNYLEVRALFDRFNALMVEVFDEGGSDATDESWA